MMLLELAERCEQATGPDYGLSQEIFAALGLVPNRADIGYPGYHYTGSLDAAMTLVPEGWGIGHLDYWPHGEGMRSGVTLDNGIKQFPPSVGATPALALCAAALRAQSPEESDREK